MADRRSAISYLFLALTVATALAVPIALYVVAARAVEQPAPDLWWLVFLPLVPGIAATVTARPRRATLVAVLATVVLTFNLSYLAAMQGDSEASQKLEALQYDDACNTTYSGMSVPFRVDAAFKDVGRVDSHHLHGPISGGFRGCTMVVGGDGDEAFAAWRAHLIASGWRVVGAAGVRGVAPSGVSTRARPAGPGAARPRTQARWRWR
jgi:hypothetical protein